jgi:CBS domain-containing protein
VKVLAQGKDPSSTTAGELGEGKPVTIGADDSVDDALKTMKEHKVRRLPVIDGHSLVGIVAIADVARALPDRPVGDLMDAVTS